MPCCHQCYWDDKPPSDAKAEACVSCATGHPEQPLSNKGRVHVSIDSGSAQTAAGVEAAMRRHHDGDGDGAIDLDDPSVATAMEQGGMRVLLYFRSLRKEQVVLLWQVLRDGSLAAAADKLGRTRAMLSKMWRDLVAERPELCEVIAGTHQAHEPEPKLRRVANRPRDGMVQQDLFGDIGQTGQ